MPPSLPERLLARALSHERIGASILGDLAEEHHRVRRSRGARAAAFWYWRVSMALALRYAWRRAVSHLRRSTRVGPPPRKRASTMEGIWRDVRQGLRALIREPAFSLMVACTLGIGLAANATILAVADGLIFRPFPLPSIDRLVRVFGAQPQGGPFANRSNLPPADFLDFQRESRRAERFVAMSWWEANITASQQPERIQAFRVSPGFFDLLEITPILGRSFSAAEGEHGRHHVVVLGYGLWMGRYAGDRGILGGTIELDGEPHTVIGVAPPGFDYPVGSQAWTALAFTPEAARQRDVRPLFVIGRLADGYQPSDLQAELSTMTRRIAEAFPESHRGWNVNVMSLAAGERDIGIGAFLAVWQASAFLILLIACANVANLMLVRGAGREKSLAVTVALGASRGRVIRQQLIEGAVLALTGAALAVPLAWMALRALTASLPPHISRFVRGWDQIDIDGRGLAATAALAIASAVIFGIVPAWRASRVALVGALKEGGRGTVGGRHRFRQALVVAEIALALTLLVAAGLSVRGLLRTVYRDDGYDPKGLMTLRVTLPEARYATADSRRQFFERLVEKAAARPEVERAAVINVLPSGGNNNGRTLEIDGRSARDDSERPRADYRTITPDTFPVFKIALQSGRQFGTGDRADTLPVAIVNRTMAARIWPNEDPIGKRFRPVRTQPWLTVVGVAADVRHDWFLNQLDATFYVPFAQAPRSDAILVLRARGEPEPLGAVGRTLVRELDADQPVHAVRTMTQVRSDRALGLRFAASLMGAFAGIGLVLAAIGVYGVMAYSVNQRTHEIGIRMALGALRSDIVRTMVGQGLRLTIAGLAIGLLSAYALARAMESLLFGTISLDALSFAAFTAILALVAIVATLVPTRRAVRVDPVVALRVQ